MVARLFSCSDVYNRDIDCSNINTSKFTQRGCNRCPSSCCNLRQAHTLRRNNSARDMHARRANRNGYARTGVNGRLALHCRDARQTHDARRFAESSACESEQNRHSDRYVPRRLRHNAHFLQMHALRRGILPSFKFSVKAVNSSPCRRRLSAFAR